MSAFYELKKMELLTEYRIEEIENKIGAGLIEEVIQVAEGELKLVDVMLNAKVYSSPALHISNIG